MKASQMIEQLQALVAEHGDLECICRYGSSYMLVPLDEVKCVTLEQASKMASAGVDSDFKAPGPFVYVGWEGAE